MGFVDKTAAVAQATPEAVSSRVFRIVHLADAPANAELIERTLESAGILFTSRRVDARDAFIEALESFKPDIVVADYNLPDFSDAEILEHVHNADSEIPVVMVCGAFPDGATIERRVHGTVDYVLKNDLQRLPAAVNRAIANAKSIRARDAAETELRQSEQRFRGMIEQEIAGICIIGPDGSFSYVNPHLAELLGYTSEELMGQPLLNCVAPPDRTSVSEAMDLLFSGKQNSAQISARAIRKNGALVDVLAQGTVTNYKGNLAIIGVVLDITEQKRTERLLAESTALLTAEHELSPDGILIVDAQRRIISFNSRFVDMWGIPADVVAAKSDERALASVIDKLADPKRFIDEVEAIYRNPTLSVHDEISLKNGSVFERHSSPMSSAGAYLGRVFFFRDISARKRAEATIRFQADQYTTMLATTADGFGRIDTTGKHIDVNEAYCRMSGYSRTELLNLRVSDLEVVESPEDQVRHIERVISNGFERFESRHRRKDGSVYDVEVSVSWWPEGGQLLFYCRDISERKRAEEALRNSNAMLATTERIAEIGGWDWDIPRDSVVWSDKLKHIFHVPLDFVPTVQAFLDFTHPDDQARVGESITASLKDNAPYDLEFRIVLPDKSEKVIHTQGEIARDPSGNPTRMFGTSQDVTRRATIEHELAVNTAVLAAEHEASPDGILVVDKNSRIVSFNSRFTDIWKIPPELIESHDDGPVLEFVTRQNADPEAFIARVKHLYSHPNDRSFECLRLADGRSIDRYTAPMSSADGANLGRVWFFRDRTEQIRIENKLREDEAQFRALLEQSVAGIFIVKADGTIGYINRHFAEMAGYRVEETLGQPVLNFIDDAHKAAVVDAIGRLMSGAASSAQLQAAIVRKGDGLLDVFLQGTLASYQGHPAIIGVAVDITERNRAEAALKRTNRALKTLSGGNAALVRSASESDLLDTMCNVAIESGGYRLAWIGFAEHDDAKSVRLMAWAGDDPNQLGLANVSWGDSELGNGPTGIAIRTGRPQINQSVETNPAMAPWRAIALAHGCHSSVALPLKDRSGTYGAFVIYAAEPDAFDNDEMKLLVEMAEDLSYGINSLRDRAAREEGAERLRKSLDATVQAIASTLELRDPYTAGHQRNVAKIAAAIARDIGIPDDEIQGIYLAGVVHDIGKINVPSEILSKPGKLSKLEYMIVQNHAQAGYDIIKGVDFPWPVAQMILQHHERLDGSGYPHGLKDEAILPGAKIIAVADVVEAMTAHRPYRPALGLDAALAEIEMNKGRLYDERAVDACVKIMRSGILSLD